ncbi:MAG TPA: DUF4783 domain-containing protein [Mucilaginibacter sp.]|jgi:hypothetical protein|nr:DUF4783 domain-containing protein [Mucilaginibacter sp.]
MKRLYLSLFVIFIVGRGFAADDPIYKVANLIMKGNMHELSALMADNVQISMPGTDNTYPKAQAEALLNKFFSQNKPISVKVLHKIVSNANYGFGVLLMNTGQRVYRIALTLNEIDGSLRLIELRIETGKTK